MKFDDVTIITWDLPPEKVKKPNKETSNLVRLILNSKFFNDFADYIFEQDEAPVLSTDDYIGQLNEKFNTSSKDISEGDIEAGFKHMQDLRYVLFEPYEREFYEFLTLFSLPSSFAWDIFLLIRFNAFREINLKDFPIIVYVPTQGDIANEIRNNNEYALSSAIWLDHQVTKSELIKWIEQNWDDIDKEMKTYLPESPIKRIYLKDMALASEIYQLYSQGHKQTKIQKLLSEKYKDDVEVYDKLTIEYIKNKVRRYKKLLDREINPKRTAKINNEYGVTFIGQD